MGTHFMRIDEVPEPYAVCRADGELLAASRHGEQAQGFVQAKYTFPILAVCSQRLCLTVAEDNSTSELHEAIVTLIVRVVLFRSITMYCLLTLMSIKGRCHHFLVDLKPLPLCLRLVHCS